MLIRPFQITSKKEDIGLNMFNWSECLSTDNIKGHKKQHAKSLYRHFNPKNDYLFFRPLSATSIAL